MLGIIKKVSKSLQNNYISEKSENNIRTKESLDIICNFYYSLKWNFEMIRSVLLI